MSEGTDEAGTTGDVSEVDAATNEETGVLAETNAG